MISHWKTTEWLSFLSYQHNYAMIVLVKGVRYYATHSTY